MMVKHLINNSKLFHDIYFRFFINKLKKRNRQFLKSAAPKSHIWIYEDLIQQVRRRSNPDDNSVCHIIGSGWSLNKSKAIIKDKDFVIGFNQAALSGLNFDLYFTEFGGSKVKDISVKQIALIEEIVKKQTGLIFFKNVYDEKNDVDFIKNKWGEKINYIPDIQVPVFHEKYLAYTLKYILKKDKIFLKQYCSTTLSAISIAKNSGFKNIVLHGVDFGGQYFFDVPGYDNLISYRPSEENSISYGKASKGDVHITAHSKLGMKASLPIVNRLCLEEGVKLWAATEKSPLSNMLSVFQEGPVSVR